LILPCCFSGIHISYALYFEHFNTDDSPQLAAGQFIFDIV